MPRSSSSDRDATPACHRRVSPAPRAATAPLVPPVSGAMPAAPLLRLAVDPEGRPLAALNLILGRQPSLGEGPLADLVQGGLLGLTAEIDAAAPGISGWQIALTLGDTTLAQVEATGPRAALSAILDETAARGVLAHLAGSADRPLRLTAQCAPRTAPTQAQMMTLAIRLDRLHGALADFGGPVLDAAALEAAIFRALAAGDIEDHPAGADPAALARALAHSLPPWLPMLLTPVVGGHVLRPRPPGMASLTVSVRVGALAAATAAPQSLTADLGALLAAAVADAEGADRIIRCSVPGADGALAPLPPLQRRTEARATRDAEARLPMVMAGRLAVSPALTVQPGPPLAALARPITLLPQTGALAGMIGVAGDAAGPLVARLDDGTWPDNTTAGQTWYAPELVPVAPGPGNPDAFRFDLRRSGMNMSGRAGLDATISLRLRPQPGTAALAAQAAGANLRPVPIEALAVALAIPFRDADGQTRQQLFPAELAPEADDYRVTVRLIDDWARLAYGALAYEGFQSLPAELRIQYGFDGLESADPTRLNIARLGKLNRLPLRRPTRGGGDAQGKGLRDALMTLAPLGATLAIRPTLIEAAPVPVVQRPWIVSRRFVIARTLPLSMPCARYGSLYREATDAGESPVGCREAFRLGETTLRLYQPMPEYSDATVAVFVSLTQPGRFLAVPRRYVIGRHPASDGDRALKPTATLYSTLDADRPDQNLCVMIAALVPDLDPGRLRALKAALALATGTPPVLDLPQDIDAEAAFLWSLPGTLRPETTRSRDGFTVSLTAPLDRAPLLRDMMLGGLATGRAILTLPDNSRIETELALDLTAIRGPNPEGPVAATLDPAGGLVLVNRLSQPVRVTGVALATPAGPVLLALDQPLAAQETARPALTLPDGAADPLAHTAPLGGAAALDETRSFTEDIRGTVVFLNLIDLTAHGVALMQIAAELPGGGPARLLSFRPDTITQSAEYVLPLTEVLAAPAVRFTITRVGNDGQSVTLAPRSLDLTQAGHVISLIWEDTP